jgi:DNA-binding Lrp family transcriptional regulator
MIALILGTRSYCMVSAFVLVNCHFPFDSRIMADISNMPFVSDVHRTEGRYDLMVRVNADTEDGLKEAISKGISAVKGVDAVVSLTIA